MQSSLFPDCKSSRVKSVFMALTTIQSWFSLTDDSVAVEDLDVDDGCDLGSLKGTSPTGFESMPQFSNL